MDDLISREAAVKMLREKAKGYFVSMFATSSDCHVARVVAMECAAEIKDMPAVDAEPVRHGEWISMVFTDTGKSAGYKCSECGLGAKKKFAYCHCGAKMDGGDPHD